MTNKKNIISGLIILQFRSFSVASECIFSLINGDDMFVTFSYLQQNKGPIWQICQVYLYLFVILHIYVILNLFIAIVLDAYELIQVPL